MESFEHALSEALRAAALALPETSEGSSCVNRAFKARKKNFLFLGEKPEGIRVMVKLGPSLDEATALAAERPDQVTVGKGGWVTLLFPADQAPDQALLEQWVQESFRLLAPKTLVAQLS
jgi:hypothetical protein